MMMVYDQITQRYKVMKLIVPRCGPGGRMRACHAAGPDSIPGRDKFSG